VRLNEHHGREADRPNYTPVALLMGAFFTPQRGQPGRGAIERLKLRTADRDAPISKKAAGAQVEAIRE
jgi:hypothetical protein